MLFLLKAEPRNGVNMKNKILILILAFMLAFVCVGCEPDTGGYTGPWWTELGGNAQHTGVIDTADFGTPGLGWIYEVQNDAYSSSCPLVVNGYVYFGTTDGYIYCIRSDNKRQSWKFKTEAPVTNTLIYKDDVIYAAGNDGYVYALNAENGKLIWFESVGDSVRKTPVIANDMIIVGTDSGKVCALSLKNGAEQWRYLTSSYAVSTDITYYDYGVDGGIVYFGSEDIYFYALNAKTGKFIWSFYTSATDIKTCAAYDGKIYFGAGNGVFHAMDALTGKEIWSFKVTDGLYISGAPAVKDGKVIFGAYDWKLYCLDAETGSEIWTHNAYYWITSAPTIVGNSVLVGGSGNRDNKFYLYCVDFDTGRERWTSQVSGNVRVAPSVVNGCIYYTEEGGTIIKLS